MTQTTSKWDKFIAFSNRTMVPINYVSLASGLIVVGASIWGQIYNVWFWMAIGLILWSLVDIIKWRRRKRAQRAAMPVGPEDSPNWNKQG